MRLDALVRLIGSLEFHQLRELALEYLVLTGYKNPTLTDGWRDGGADLKVMRADGVSSRLLVQVSVAAKWEQKLRSDLDKAITKYAPSSFLYVSSRRIPEADFGVLATEYRNKGLEVRKVDNQALASIFFEKRQSSRVLLVAGLDVGRSQAPVEHVSPFDEAAFAYLFLSDDAREFRSRVLERAILGRVMDKPDSESGPQVVDEIAATVGLAGNQKWQVQSELDRLLTKGAVVKAAGRLRVEPGAAVEFAAQRALLGAAWEDLERALADAARKEVPAARKGEVIGSRLLDTIGPALTLSSEITAAGGLRPRSKRSELLPKLRERLLDLSRLLEDWGVNQPETRDRVIEELIGVAAGTQPGQALVAAEIFIALASLAGNPLGQAIGGDTLPPVVLDASVAIPMILSLLFEPGTSRFFLVAKELHRQSQLHGIRLVLPDDYLEEAAVHLIEGWRDYREIVDLVDELEQSTNAYVAHYVHQRKEGGPEEFSTYLNGLGVRPGILNSGEFSEQRRIIVQQLRQCFTRFGFEVRAIPKVWGQAFEAAARQVREAAAGRGRSRPAILVEHDARVVCYLDSTTTEQEILCSWDRALLKVQRQADHTWLAVEPTALVDLLSLASASPEADISLVSPGTWARQLIDADGQRAADIWDWMARQESGGLRDGALLATAREFVDSFISEERPARHDVLAEAWKDWKDARREPVADHPSGRTS